MSRLGTARDWLTTLFVAKLHATQGILLTQDGVEHSSPNPAALWPPHRPHPHQARPRSHNSHRRLARRAKKAKDGLVVGIIFGRVGYVSRHKLLKVCA